MRWTVTFGWREPYAAPWAGGPPIHRGLDLTITGAPNGGMGTPYTAFAPGTVIAAGPMSWPSGNGVILQADDGLYHAYFHNAQVLVSPGQRVDTSTPLAVLGETGVEGQPHVHFEVRRNVNGDPIDQLIDPRPYLNGGGAVGATTPSDAAPPESSERNWLPWVIGGVAVLWALGEL